MTDRRTNRLIGVGNGGESTTGAPTSDIVAYCAWLNAHELRRGQWRIIVREGKRTVEFKEEVATNDWLREKGLIPKVGSAA